MANNRNGSSQRGHGLKTERPGERGRPSSAMSRHSLQSPVSGAEEEDPTPEELIQNNPKYADEVGLMGLVIDGCQKILKNPKTADLDHFGQLANTFGEARDEAERPLQIFMADYLAVKGFIPLSKQLHKLMLQKGGVSSMLQWECSGTEEDLEERSDFVIAQMMESNWCNLSDASHRIARKMAPTTIFNDLISSLRECEKGQHNEATVSNPCYFILVHIHNF